MEIFHLVYQITPSVWPLLHGFCGTVECMWLIAACSVVTNV